MASQWRLRTREVWARAAVLGGALVFAAGSVLIYAAPPRGEDPVRDPVPSRYDLSLPSVDPLPEFRPRPEAEPKPKPKATPKAKAKTDARPKQPGPEPAPVGGLGDSDLRRSDPPVHRPKPVATPTPKPTPTRIPSTPIPTSKPAPRPSAPAAPVSANAEARAQVMQLVNQQRADYGLSPLASNSSLFDSAQKWSAQMSAEGRMYHSGHAPENVAWGYSTAAQVVAAWMASPGHRANILDPGSTLAGVGLVGTYWTLQFQ